ncbi:nucleoside hydrolase [Marisediminicola senii]|uniref:nucleoside hydrolase n=1 Tax=Marisediminicola senii TaxID=2711233 RepID=UPI0013ED6E71|nr:nucleoside hydrolase [Marisediminicola senii]
MPPLHSSTQHQPPLRLLLDCDPGLDDALALLLAHADPALQLVAVTTVGGNVSLENTTRNALQLRQYLGFERVPVAAGAPAPLARPARSAAHVHGEEGLGDVRLPVAGAAASTAHAVDTIVDTLRDSPGDVHLVATGPLTNIALALRREPRIVEWAASFVIMGGSYTRGNATPAAEFNIYADPEAAAEVFAANWNVVMIGLDATLQAIATPTIVDRMRALGSLGTEFAVPLSTFWTDPNDADWPGQAVHDVCAVAYVARPDLFVSRPALVRVETEGEYTSGMTVVDFNAADPDAADPNATVVTTVDVDAFWDYVLGVWALVAPEIDDRAAHAGERTRG